MPDEPDDGELTWDNSRELPLEEILEKLEENCIHHWRLRDSEGNTQVVITLARGKPARVLDEVVTERFREKVSGGGSHGGGSHGGGSHGPNGTNGVRKN